MKRTLILSFNFLLFLYIMLAGSLLVTIRWLPGIDLFPWSSLIESGVQRYLLELQEMPSFLALFALPSFLFSMMRLRELSEHEKT